MRCLFNQSNLLNLLVKETVFLECLFIYNVGNKMCVLHNKFYTTHSENPEKVITKVMDRVTELDGYSGASYRPIYLLVSRKPLMQEISIFQSVVIWSIVLLKYRIVIYLNSEINMFGSIQFCNIFKHFSLIKLTMTKFPTTELHNLPAKTIYFRASCA